MTAHPTLDAKRPARPRAEQDVDDRSAPGAPERRTTTKQPSSEVARSSSAEPRGPRTYLPGYYLG